MQTKKKKKEHDCVIIKDVEKVHHEAHTLVEHPLYSFVNNDSNEINNTQLGMGSKFLFNPSFIKQQISAALCSFTSCTTPLPQLTRDICMLAKTFFGGKITILLNVFLIFLAITRLRAG